MRRRLRGSRRASTTSASASTKSPDGREPNDDGGKRARIQRRLMNADCLFCRIVAGEIPSDVVVDRPTVYAFRDIAPAAPLHVLVIPKEHVVDARTIDASHGSLLAEMLDAANEVARSEGIVDGGFRLVFNVGPDAGQTVFHLHLHVLGGAPLGPMAS